MKNSMVKYSFVIPVYQSEEYLSECLESIINQTYKNFEIILVDDGSTDNSGVICDEYSKTDERIIVFHKNNEGQGIARNIGINKASGKYIIFVDSDDYWKNNKMLEKIDSLSNEADVIFFDLVFLYKNKNIDLGITKKLKDCYENGIDFMTHLLTINHSFPWYPVLYAFKKDIWINNNLSFPCKTFFEDQALVYKIPLFANKISILKENVYVYRKNQNTSTTINVTFKLLNDHINVCNDAIIFINNQDFGNNLKELLLNNVACGYVDTINHVNLLNKNDYLKMIDILKRNEVMVDYIKYGKQKYMSKIIKAFGIKFSASIFGFIRKTRNIFR